MRESGWAGVGQAGPDLGVNRGVNMGVGGASGSAGWSCPDKGLARG